MEKQQIQIQIYKELLTETGKYKDKRNANEEIVSILDVASSDKKVTFEAFLVIADYGLALKRINSL